MAELPLEGIDHVKKTLIFKKIQGKDLTVDVRYVDLDAPGPQLAILYFHGGFLLIQAALRRCWTIISANYCCLPESTAHDISEDLVDAYRYVSNNLSQDLRKPGLIDSSRIILAGHSGGYCAVKTTLEVLKRTSTESDLKRPVVTIVVYPMLDFLSPKWSIQGIDLVPVFVDHFTGINGLGKKLASAGTTMEEAIPLKERPLFVLDFDNLTPEMPPLFVIHGLADTAVPFEDSDKLVEKTKALKIPTRYWRLEGLDHEFDLEFPDLERRDVVMPEDARVGKQAVRELLQGLGSVLQSS
ncbi:alpha/beta-hydrolase [Acephala macrosclerotiorum]|nr:alpha/beta-hydrolase [Acephala macrosclerotiorum]